MAGARMPGAGVKEEKSRVERRRLRRGCAESDDIYLPLGEDRLCWKLLEVLTWSHFESTVYSLTHSLTQAHIPVPAQAFDVGHKRTMESCSARSQGNIHRRISSASSHMHWVAAHAR